MEVFQLKSNMKKQFLNKLVTDLNDRPISFQSIVISDGFKSKERSPGNAQLNIIGI